MVTRLPDLFLVMIHFFFNHNYVSMIANNMFVMFVIRIRLVSLLIHRQDMISLRVLSCVDCDCHCQCQKVYIVGVGIRGYYQSILNVDILCLQ